MSGSGVQLTVCPVVKFAPFRVMGKIPHSPTHHFSAGLIDVSVEFGKTGVTAAEAADAGPVPMLLVAVTVQVYGSLFVRLVTMMGLEAPDAVPELEPLEVDEQVAV